VELSDLVHLWSVLVVASVFWPAERIVKHVLRFHERVLDHEIERAVVEKEGSQGLLNLAELERARRHKRRRLQLPGTKKENGSPHAAVIFLAAYAVPVLDPTLPTWLLGLCRWLSWITGGFSSSTSPSGWRWQTSASVT
jgi:hypothetical protein